MKYPHIVLITGDDEFSIQQTIKKWKSSFIEKHGDYNISQLEGKKLSAKTIIEQAEQLPFLAEKRMIFVYDFLKKGETEEQKKFAQACSKIPDQTVIVFIEKNEPDKRLTLFKTLNKDARIENISAKSGSALTEWVLNHVREHNGNISQKNAQILSNTVGKNMWQLSNEIQKLCTYSDGNEITEKEIALLTESHSQTTIFKFVDEIGQKNNQTALNLLHTLINNGEELIFIFHMIIRQIRLISLTHAAGNQPSGVLAKMLKVPPFAVNTLIRQSKNFNKKQLKKLYEMLFSIEVTIKTGKIRISTDNQDDMILALERFILEACN